MVIPRRLFSLFLVCLFVSSFVLAQGDIGSSLDSTAGQVEEGINLFEEQADVWSDQGKWEERWAYVGDGFSEFFLRNSVIAFFDSLFQQISPLFFVLMGLPYSFSLLFFFALAFWIFVFWDSTRLFRSYGLFRHSPYAFVGGAIVALVLGQLHFYEFILELAVFVVLSPDATWIRFAAFCLMVVLAFLLEGGLRWLSNYLDQKATAMQTAAAQRSERRLITFTDRLFGQNR